MSFVRMFPALVFSGVLTLALWRQGLGEQGTQGPFVAGLVTAVAVAAVVRLARGSAVTGESRDRRWLVPLAGVVVLVALQAANPSHRFLADSRGLQPLPHLPFLPRSVDRGATLEALLLLAGYGSVFWLARVCLADVRSRAVFVAVQAMGGVCMAGLVIAQRNIPPDGALYAVTGVFVSPNHYVAYANLLMPVLLLWGWDLHQRARRRGAWVHAGYLLLGAAGVLLVSVFRCDSRMGMAVSGLLVIGAVAGEVRALHSRRQPAAWVAAGALFALTVVGGFWALSSSPMAMEFRRLASRLPEDLAARVPVWRATLAMGADRWVSGTGAGTFAVAFPYYQPGSLPGFYRHAHNELLQIVAELGVVGTVLLAGLLYGVLSGGPAGGGPGRDLTGRERRGITLALGGLALQAMVDFPLRLPALVFLAAAWVGMSGGRLIPDGGRSAALADGMTESARR